MARLDNFKGPAPHRVVRVCCAADELTRRRNVWEAGAMVVLGVDAYRGGWVAVALRADGSTNAFTGPTLELLTAPLKGTADEPEVVAVDIPIGLPVDGQRAADVAVRQVLGPRRSSVFFTPVRQALLAATHAEATEISVELTGKGISQQAYALRARIFDAEAFVESASYKVVEVHPEVSFTLMHGSPAPSSKKTWAGLHQRLRALIAAGVHLDDFGVIGEQVAPDDVLDAAAAAWTAQRVATGADTSFPSPAPIDSRTGRPIAIRA